METINWEELGVVGIIAAIIGGLVALLIMNVIQTLIVKYATQWSAQFKPRFWSCFWRVLLISIITSVVGQILLYITGNDWLNLLIGFVIAVLLIKPLIKGPEGQQMNYGNAIVVTLIWYVAVILFSLGIGAVAAVMVAAA